MSEIDNALKEIESLMDRGGMAEPEERLCSLIRQMGEDQRVEWKADLLKVINRFFPKRRKSLLAILEGAGAGYVPAKSSPNSRTKGKDLGGDRIRFLEKIQKLLQLH